MSEEESQRLLEQEGQWLLRMDRDGFIVTEATSINENGSANVKNHRLRYECGSFYMDGKTYTKLAHIMDLFPIEMAYQSSPYFAVCYHGHPSYFDNADNLCYDSWKQLMGAIT